MKPTIIVVGALIERDGRVLVTRRPPGGSHGGMWEFPGGKVRPGEDDRDALGREIREELGVTVRVGERFVRVLHDYALFHIDFRVHRCDLEPGADPQMIEVVELRWIDPAAPPDLSFPAADVPVLERLRELAGAPTADPDLAGPARR